MKFRAAVTVVLLAFVASSLAVLAVKELGDGRPGPDEAQGRKEAAGAASAAGDPEFIAYYFHGATRCLSCRVIESYTRETLETAFGGMLADGTLTWRVVNVSLPENRHFIQDFGLYAPSVVLAQLEDGRTVRWKNLELVWGLLRDKAAFQRYVEEETRRFIAGG